MYKTFIKSILMYDSETWVLCQVDIKRLNVFESKIMRRIYGLIVERVEWRIRFNNKLYEL